MQDLNEASDGGSSRLARRWVWASLVLLAGLAFAVTLTASLPAQIAARWVAAPVPPSAVGGTLWRGSLQIDRTHVLRWQTALGRSLAAGALVADMTVEGPGTALTGEMRARPARADLRIEGVAGWPLAAALRPDLAVVCETALVLRLVATVGRQDRTGEGQGTSAAGRCGRLDGTVTDVPLPALVYRLTTGVEGLLLAVETDARPVTPMAEARLTPDDRLQLTLRHAAAAMVPGLPASGDFALDLPLSALSP